jgi:OmpA-OmpF porin, OOP family
MNSTRTLFAPVSTRRRRTSLAAVLTTALLGASGSANAEVPVVDNNGDGFDSHLFRPALDSKGFFHTNGTDVLGANDVSFGFIVDYGFGLLRVRDQGQSRKFLLDHSIQGTLQFNYGIKNRAAVGLSLPINLMFGEGQVKPDGQAVLPNQWTTSQVAAQNIGAPAIHGKVKILNVEKGFGLAAGLQLGAPLTKAPREGGADPKFFFWPQLIAEKHLGETGWFKIGANAGFRGHVVSDTQLELEDGKFRDGNRVTYGLGLAARVATPVELAVDTYGTILIADAATKQKFSNEVVGGIKLFIEGNSYLMVGGGTRYTPGFEAATVRAFIGIIFEPSIGDRDGDGIKDDVDKCIDEPEDFDGVEDEDGCPEPDVTYRVPPTPPEPPPKPKPPEDGDRDGDGIPDSRDKCPDVPENYNGIEDEDGCPERDVAVGDGGLVLFKKIKFARDSAEILPESFELVDQIAATIKEHPEFLLMEIAGHADERAPDLYNLNLTQRRSDSVVNALVKRGIDKSRLRAKGYGEYCPEDDGHNEVAWEKNRRVEFKIVKSKDGGTPPQLGCANASAKGVKPDPIP